MNFNVGLSGGLSGPDAWGLCHRVELEWSELWSGMMVVCGSRSELEFALVMFLPPTHLDEQAGFALSVQSRMCYPRYLSALWVGCQWVLASINEV